MSRDWKNEAERAIQSARAGRWDLVRRYVENRPVQGKAHDLDAATAEALVSTDRAIESMLLVARAAVKSLLDDVSSTRRAAGLIRAKLLGATGVSSSISRRV